MGTRERRQRELGNREQLILENARELIRVEGLLNLQMARLAEKCEYAVGTLYQHFSSKEDLVLALTEEDVSEHVGLFARAAAWRGSTRDRIFALSVADLIFIRHNPEHFRVAQYALCDVVWRAASPGRRQRLLAAQRPLGAIAIGIIEAAIAAGELRPRGLTPAQITVSIWSQTVGMHHLVHTDGLLEDESLRIGDPYRLMCRNLQALLNGLGWRPLMDLEDESALDALIDRIRKEVFDDGSCQTHP